MKLSKLWLGAATVAAVTGITMVTPRSTATLSADAVKCDLSEYKSAQGLTAAIDQDLLVVTWAGQSGSDLRARYAIDNGQPVIRDFSIRKAGGQWAALGQNLTPE